MDLQLAAQPSAERRYTAAPRRFLRGHVACCCGRRSRTGTANSSPTRSWRTSTPPSSTTSPNSRCPGAAARGWLDLVARVTRTEHPGLTPATVAPTRWDFVRSGRRRRLSPRTRLAKMPYVMVQIPKQPAPSPLAPRSVPASADVARLAGVSRATVSYVLNNTSAVRISEPTRRRVHEAASGSRVRPARRGPLPARRTQPDGADARAVLPRRTALQPVPQRTPGALGRLDYTVVQYGTVGLYDDEAARAWAELRPVAVLVPGSGLGPRGVEVLKRSGARAVVTLGPEAVEEHTPCSWTTRPSATPRRPPPLRPRTPPGIGVVVPAEDGLDVFSAPRLAGVRRAVRDTDATVTELPLAYEERDAARLAARWRSLGLDAVFAYNDEYAMLLMRAMQDEGLGIPADAAVIGADDLMLGRLLRPRLSTVHLELPSGRDLAALVDRAVHDPTAAPERHEVLGAAVVHRESS